jgi:hypothetical protein
MELISCWHTGKDNYIEIALYSFTGDPMVVLAQSTQPDWAPCDTATASPSSVLINDRDQGSGMGRWRVIPKVEQENMNNMIGTNNQYKSMTNLIFLRSIF